MRKFDKKLNILKANLLSEQRYAENKDPLNEGWKTNVAAGLASIAGGAGANAQAQQAPQQNQGTSIQQQAQAPKADDGKTSNAFNTPRTLPIVAIQSGVQDGKTGKSGVYVYHKLPTDPSFDVNRDREIVYNENLPNLRKTVEYQDYMRQKQGGQQAQGGSVAMNEGEKKNLIFKEGWKTNLAAGLAMAGGVAGNSGSAGAKPQYQSTQPEMTQFDKPIVGVKAHNQDGVNGFYVYHKSPNDPSFNKVADLSWVSADNWSQVSKTPAFRNFVDHSQGDSLDVQAPMR